MPRFRRGWSLLFSRSRLFAALGIRERQQAGLFKAGLILEAEIKRELSKPGTGRTYTVELRTIRGRVVPVGSRVPHRASAPGKPPAVDRGELRASVGTAKVEGGKVRVGPGIPKPSQRGFVARVLHNGVFSHPGGIMIEPRPFMRKPAERAKSKMDRAVLGDLRSGGPETLV